MADTRSDLEQTRSHEMTTPPITDLRAEDAASDSERCRWRVSPAGQLLTAEFDGQTVVYHTGAGHTHWISPVAAEILLRLAVQPESEPELLAALALSVDMGDAYLLAESVNESIERLRDLSLIERA